MSNSIEALLLSIIERSGNQLMAPRQNFAEIERPGNPFMIQSHWLLVGTLAARTAARLVHEYELAERRPVHLSTLAARTAARLVHEYELAERRPVHKYTSP